MATRFSIEEESNLEDSLDAISIRSMLIESVKEDSFSKVSFDEDDFRQKLTGMLVSANASIDRIGELISYYKWSLSGNIAHGIVETFEPDPQYVLEHMIQIKTLIKEGLSHLEKLYRCSDEIFQMIGCLLIFGVRLPDLPDFEVPQPSLTDSLARMLSSVDIKNIVEKLASTQCMRILFNTLTHYILTLRNYRRNVGRFLENLSVEFISRQISFEVRQMKEGMEHCLDKISQFGIMLESSEVRAKLKSANTMLEVAISQDFSIAILRSIFQSYSQFQISLKCFSEEERNIGKSKDELFQELKNNSISSGLIFPIASTLKCSNENAWKILKHLDLRNARQASIAYKPLDDLD